ncbi:MAG: hypothetical protein PUG48_05125 [Clostridia bacterium]|nr:hypothetical protein [Clostridia bacterium]
MRLRLLGIQGATSFELVSAATAKLSGKELIAALATTNLTNKERERILIEHGLSGAVLKTSMQTLAQSTANTTATVTTGALTTATSGLSAAFRGLWNVIKAHPIMTIIATVTMAISLFEQLRQQTEEASREATQNAVNGANDLKNSLDDIDSYIRACLKRKNCTKKSKVVI